MINLGDQPLANNLSVSKKKKQKKYELKVIICKLCKTPQLSIDVNPKILFSKYVWQTGTSSLAKIFSQKFYGIVIKNIDLKQPNVLEIASNDGTFLKPFKKKGCNVLGVDPAKNIIQIAKQKNKINTLRGFFSYNFSKKIKKNKFNPDVIFARNVIAHTNNVKSFVKGIENLIKSKGIVAIEFHYAKNIVIQNQYDSIYHEHIFYFSLKTISHLFRLHNLYAYDAVKSPISGGALIVFFKKKKTKKTKRYKEILFQENLSNINSVKRWIKFSNQIQNHSKNLKKKLFDNIKKDKIIAYGASARSSTLLNYCKLTNHEIDYIIDQNPMKYNKFSPGSNIKIIKPAQGLKILKKRKNLLLLAWNFKKEILKFLKKNNFKGKIIQPLPNKLQIINL